MDKGGGIMRAEVFHAVVGGRLDRGKLKEKVGRTGDVVQSSHEKDILKGERG